MRTQTKIQRRITITTAVLKIVSMFVFTLFFHPCAPVSLLLIGAERGRLSHMFRKCRKCFVFLENPRDFLLHIENCKTSRFPHFRRRQIPCKSCRLCCVANFMRSRWELYDYFQLENEASCDRFWQFIKNGICSCCAEIPFVRIEDDHTTDRCQALIISSSRLKLISNFARFRHDDHLETLKRPHHWTIPNRHLLF